MRKLFAVIASIPRKLAVGAITGYQKTFSPDHGPLKDLYPYGFCRHEPTCSEYGKKVIEEHGVLIGTTLTTKRLLTCHPWKKVSKEKIVSFSRVK